MKLAKTIGMLIILLCFVTLTFQNCSPLNSAKFDVGSTLSRTESIDPRLFDSVDEISKFAESSVDPNQCFLDSISVLNWTNSQEFDETNFTTQAVRYSPTLVTVISIANENAESEPLPPDLKGWSIKPIRKNVNQKQTVTDIIIQKLTTSEVERLNCFAGSIGNLELIKDIGGDGQPVSLLGYLNDTSKILACKISSGDMKINILSNDHRLIHVSQAAPIVFKRGCNVEYEREYLTAQQATFEEDQILKKNVEDYAKTLALSDQLTSTTTAQSTTPSAPKITSVVAGNQSAEIRFNAPSSTGGSPIKSYDIFLNDQTYPSRTAISSPFTITGLVNNVAYKFKIAASNISGTGTSSAFSDTITPNDTTVPAPPLKVRAEPQSGTQDEYYNTKIFFDAPSNFGASKITRFDVYNSAGMVVASGTGSPITVVYSDLNNKIVQSSGTTYTYSVKAVNVQGSSLNSNSTTAVTAPGKLLIYRTDAESPSDKGVVLSSYIWSPNTTDDLDVTIRFKRKPMYGATSNAPMIPRPEDPVRPDQYGVTNVKGDWYCGSMDYLYLTDINKKYEVVYTKVTPNSRVFKKGCSGSFYVVPYQTTAIDMWGNITARISGASSEHSDPSVYVPIPPPAIQRIFSVEIVNDRSVKINFKPIRDGWEDNGMSPLRRWEVVNGGAGNQVLASKIYGGAAVLDETIPVNNLENGVRYELYVRAVNDIGPGAMSVAASYVIVLEGPPQAPTDLKAVTGDGQVSLSFKPAARGSRADTFEVLEMDGTKIIKVAASGFTSSPIVVKNLISTRSYTYAVRGRNFKGPGEPSASVTFTPALQAPKLIAEKSYTLAVGSIVSIQPSNTGGEISSCTATGLPDTLSIQSTTCEIYGTVKAGTNLSIVVTAKNRIASDTASFTISIVSCSVRPTKSTISRGEMLTATVVSTPTVKEIWVNCIDPRNISATLLKDATGAAITNSTIPVSIGTFGQGTYTCKSWGYLSEPDSLKNSKTTCEDFSITVDEGMTCPEGSAEFESEANAKGQKNKCAATWKKTFPTSYTNNRVFATIAPGTVANAICNDDGTFSDIQASCPVMPDDYCPGGVVSFDSLPNTAGQTQNCRGFYPALPRNRQTDSNYGTPDEWLVKMDIPGSSVAVKCDANGIISSLFKTCPVPSVATPPGSASLSYPFGGTPPVSSNLPNAPVIGSAYAGDTIVNVNFVGSTGPRNYPVTSYEVYVNNESNPKVTGTSSPIIVTGLVNGMSYTFKVKARNSIGLSEPSAASNTVSPNAAPKAPSAPTIGKVSAGDAQVTVNFTASLSNGGSPITSYEIYVNNETIARVTGAASPIVVTGLVNGTTYTFKVKARNAIGLSEPSLVSNAVVPNPGLSKPGAPTIGNATSGDAQALVYFTAPLSNGGSPITSYEIYANNETTARASGLISPITVTGLTNGTAYSFKVKALNAIGISDPSGATNVVTPMTSLTRPGPPIIGAATSGDSSAAVQFTAPAMTGGSPITSYEVYVNAETSARGSGVSSPITVTGLTNGTAYTFKVKARNAIGLSDPSGTSNVVTPMASLTRPGPPIIGAATSGDNSAIVRFTAPAMTGGSPITSYEVYVNAETSARGSGVSSPITVTGLTNGTAYTFKVKARNAIGLSDPSGASNSVTPTHTYTHPTFSCTVVNGSLTNFSVNGEIIADSSHFGSSGRYFVAGFDPVGNRWYSFDGATWYAGGSDPTNLKAIAGFTSIDSTGIRGIILSNQDMTPYRGGTLYIGYGIITGTDNTDAAAADHMMLNNLYQRCATVPN